MSATNGYANGHANGNGHDRFAGLAIAKEPPQAIQAEQFVLDNIIRDADLLPTARKILKPEDFHREAHALIYRACCDLTDAGKAPDHVMIRTHLMRHGQDRLAGLDRAMMDLIGSAPSPANFRCHAAIVKDASDRRGIAALARLMGEDVDSGRYTAAEILGRDEGRRGKLLGDSTEAVVDEDEPVANLGDIKRACSETHWLWDDWIVASHLTVLAAEPGVGKTRLALDICRRMFAAEAWPDGTMATRPKGTPSLWVASDRNHAELAKAAKEYGMPDEAVFLNAPPTDPSSGLKLDEAVNVAALGRRIARVKPGLVVIDTVNKATRRLLYRPEEAEAFFGPLLDLAMKSRTPILALTHLSKGGDPLDRRIEGTCRIMWKLERPDVEGQPHRRKLWVSKSGTLYPPPLGVTMGTEGNNYDLNPPEAAKQYGGGRGGDSGLEGGRPKAALAAAIEWVREYLADGPAYCKVVVEKAMEAGHSRATFFRACKELKTIKLGEKGQQIVRLPTAAEGGGGEDEADDEGDTDWDGRGLDA